MKKIKLSILLACGILSFLSGFAQDEIKKDTFEFPYDKNYFGSPVDGPVRLAGNFGELRNNHFHGGIDVKVEGQIGRKIYSCAEGYVSKVSLNSVWGYGKTLYITHPNGLTTLYAHLNGFAPDLDSAINRRRYLLMENKHDIVFEPDSFKVKKGQFVAYSGTTGASKIPHLHLEVRKGEVQINPLLFDFKVPDKIKPDIRGIRIYPLSDSSAVNGLRTAQYFHTPKAATTYKFYTEKDSLPFKDTISVYGAFGVGINAIDQLSGFPNVCGVYKVCLSLDSQLVYQHTMHSVEFHDSRYINSHTDYNFRKENKRWVQKSFLDQNNLLEIYDSLQNRGRMLINDTLVHQITYDVYDVHNNKNSFTFPIVMGEKVAWTPKKGIDSTKMILHNEEFNYQDTNFHFILPAYSVYNDVKLRYKKSKKAGKCLSDMHTICNEGIPLQNKAMVCFLIDSSLYCYKEKFTIGLVDANNVIVQHYGTEMNNDTAKGRVKYFGKYCLSLDTLAPYITAQNIKNKQKIDGVKEVKFTIEDWQTGLGRFDGYLDDKWELLEYDPKTKTIALSIPSNLANGEHCIRIVVIDGNLNKREVNYTVYKGEIPAPQVMNTTPITTELNNTIIK